MDDKALLSQFLDASIQPTSWDHRAHVKVGYLLLQRYSRVEATARMSEGLKHFLRANDIPTKDDMGFHETLTVAWIELIAAAMAEAGPFESADAFCNKQQHLLNKYALLFFYSRERIMSQEARYGWLAPDLTELPTPRDALAGCHASPRKDRAREFAIAAHGEQTYGEEPYVVHLDAVAQLLAPFGEDAVIVGYLHDVLEDTDVGEATLTDAFGHDIARQVALLTDIPDAPRKERKRQSHAVLSHIDIDGPDAIALIAKAADRLANSRQCHKDRNEGLIRMYQREYPAFQKATKRFPTTDSLSSRYFTHWSQQLWLELDAIYS